MLVEILLAMGLLGILLPTLIAGLITSREGKAQSQQRTQAVFLLKEGEEATRSVRDQDWVTFATFANGNPYHPVISSGTWSLAAGSETINGFTRQITINNVSRNNGDIGSGTDDPSTKLVTVTVSWTTPYSSSVTSSFYLTRHDNMSFTHTTVADFTGVTGNKSTLSGTAIVSTTGTSIPNDGQVQLGAGGGGDWCSPGSSLYTQVDLPGNGDAIAISATTSATMDYIYTTTGDNASGNAVNETSVDHNNPPNSVPAVSNYNTAKAYGIFVDHAGGYVYFTQANPGHTVQIASSSNVNSLAGYFDPGGTGKSVYVSGTKGYVTVGSNLYQFDASSATGARPQTGVVTLNGTGNRVIVKGNNAYVATSSTTNQLQIINTSTMTVSKSVSMGNGAAGVDIYVDDTQTYAYIITSYISGKPDFFVYNIAKGSIDGSYSTNGMSPKGVTVVPGGKAIIVGSGGETYQVLNLTDSSGSINPQRCGGTSTSSTISGISTIIQPNGNAFSYIITNNSTAELQVIQGGPGGQFATTGTYESPTYQYPLIPGPSPTPWPQPYQHAFNMFYADTNKPSGTTLTFKIAVANMVNNSCYNADFSNYLGPNGTTDPNDNFTGGTTGEAIPLKNYLTTYQNPGFCLRYKATFTTPDATFSPILYDVTINHSP